MQLFAANCFKSQIRPGAVYWGLLTSKKHGCEILPFGLGRERIFVCHFFFEIFIVKTEKKTDLQRK